MYMYMYLLYFQILYECIWMQEKPVIMLSCTTWFYSYYQLCPPKRHCINTDVFSVNKLNVIISQHPPFKSTRTCSVLRFCETSHLRSITFFARESFMQKAGCPHCKTNASFTRVPIELILRFGCLFFYHVPASATDPSFMTLFFITAVSYLLCLAILFS